MILRFIGGLGNQMFIYAFYRYLQEKGIKVILDYSFFVRNEWTYRIEVFPNVKVKRGEGTHSLMYYYVMKLIELCSKLVKRYYFEDQTILFDANICEHKNEYVAGYFQNDFYFRDIENTIRKELSFPFGESKLSEQITHIEKKGYTSIHIRRKDYLELSESYGGICDEDYYRQAISIIHKHDPNASFLVFSDDIEWVKENMCIPNAEYVLGDWFDHYDDWYDMCLMSHCKNNIIANSSFSWWGAWLNNHQDKVVVCPSRWTNTRPNRGLACDDWIVIKR